MNYFYHNDKQIEDIQKWCEENNTQMIRFKAERHIPNPFTLKIEKEFKEGEMPELFFNSLQMGDGWIYKLA